MKPFGNTVLSWLGGFALLALFIFSIERTSAQEKYPLYPVTQRGDLQVLWYEDEAARCYIVTNESGISGFNNGVARAVAIDCDWKVKQP